MSWYIGNAFSLSMLSADGTLKVTRASVAQVRLWLSQVPFVSFMGHSDVARLVSQELGVDVPFNRTNVSLRPGDNVVIAQYMGARLPEGAKELPEGARIEYFLVALPVETQEVTDYSFDEHSELGVMLRKAQEVARLVGGRVVVTQDNYKNYFFQIEARGFTASLWEE
jgi:hypothetical protein